MQLFIGRDQTSIAEEFYVGRDQTSIAEGFYVDRDQTSIAAQVPVHQFCPTPAKAFVGLMQLLVAAIRQASLQLLLPVLALVLAVAMLPAAAQNHDAAQGAQGNTATQDAKPALKSAFPRAGPSQGEEVLSVGGSGWWQSLLDIQRDMQRKLAGAVRGLKTGDTLSASLFLITVSFLYGVFHAVGPGHGKAVISSYVLANKTTLRRGIVLSILSGLLQAISAITIVGVLAILMKAAGLEIRQTVHRFEMASSLLIAMAGVWLLTAHLRRRFASPARVVAMYSAGAAAVAQAAPFGGQDHDENCGCGQAHMPDTQALEKNWSLRQAAAIVFAVGIRPCTGAILVLVFALAQGMLWAGVVSTFVMALGTAITVSALASIAVGSREVAVRFAGSRWTDGVYDFATIAGCVLVMLVGIGLFWESLGPVQPF